MSEKRYKIANKSNKFTAQKKNSKKFIISIKKIHFQYKKEKNKESNGQKKKKKKKTKKKKKKKKKKINI
jgi:hypothetical protein